MKIPFISTNEQLFREITVAYQALNKELANNPHAQAASYSVLHLRDSQSAIEFINYQTPALIVIDFASNGVDMFDIMRQITADPWLNHGGIVALYESAELGERINELEASNIIISLSHQEAGSLLSKVLKVIHDNRQILFQRAIQTDLISSITGQYFLEPDITIIPCYSNLIANYLYNMGFVDAEAKHKISLTLIELLINAMEHGSCGITSEEKTKYLEEFGSIHGLIAEKMKDPAVAGKKVTFQYEINAADSTYHITDEGEGFDWRKHMDPDPEMDLLSFHGRGILLSLNGVNSMTYNDAGNEVTVSITHRRNATNTVPLVFQDHEVVEFQPGDIVFREGEESDFLYYVAEGEYRVEVENKEVATITPSDILIGEMSFLLQENRSASIYASTPGKLIKISSVALINSIRNEPYYGLFLAKLLAQRLYNLARVKVRQGVA